MKLTKAIEELEQAKSSVKGHIWLKRVTAFNLLIEAGKRIMVGRNNPGTHWNEPLPGETEE